jgi:hypothetical protein
MQDDIYASLSYVKKKRWTDNCDGKKLQKKFNGLKHSESIGSCMISKSQLLRPF